MKLFFHGLSSVEPQIYKTQAHESSGQAAEDTQRRDKEFPEGGRNKEQGTRTKDHGSNATVEARVTSRDMMRMLRVISESGTVISA